MSTFNNNKFTVIGKANAQKTAQAAKGANKAKPKSNKTNNVAVVNVLKLVDVIDSVAEIDKKDLNHIKVSLKGEFINCGKSGQWGG